MLSTGTPLADSTGGLPPTFTMMSPNCSGVASRPRVSSGSWNACPGEIGGCPVYMDLDQFGYWKHTQLIIDVVPGRGAGFSAEAPEGVRFLTRSRVFTDEEVDALEAAGALPRGQS